MTTAARTPLKTVALPNEHGAWGFLLEPALLGLLLAPSLAGVFLVLAGLGGVLAQHPLSLLLSDWRRGKRYERTRLAGRFFLLYAGAALVSLAAAVAVAGGVSFLLPLVLAAPLALWQLALDAKNRGRELLPELAGASAMGALAASLALAGGWALAPALALWLLLALRTVPSILYVRARLRLERSQAVNLVPALLSHGLALGLALALAALAAAPILATIAYALLLARAALGLSRLRRPMSAKAIGFGEMGFGVLTVLVIALAYIL